MTEIRADPEQLLRRFQPGIVSERRRAVPEIVGADVLLGATGAAATTAVCGELAVADPI